MLASRNSGWLPGLLACAVVCVSAARAADGGLGSLMPGKAESQGPVDIMAEGFTDDEVSGWMTASNNVIVRHGDTELRADRIRLNRKTGEVVAEGHVLLVRLNQAATRSDRITYNYKTGEGLTSAVDLRARAYHVMAGESRRRPDGSFAMRDAVVTTCTNAPGHMHYHVAGREAAMRPREYVSMTGVTPHFLGVPFFYLPYWRKELDEHYGWRFVPGYESDWGAFLLSTYKFRLLDLGEGDSLNSRTHLDYRTERGPAGGEDLVWTLGDPGEETKGFVSGYYLKDDRPMHEDLDRDPNRDLVEDSRYRFTLRHDGILSQRDYLTLRFSYLSDSYMLEDFYMEEYKDLIQPENYGSYTHTGDGYSFGLGAYNRLNDFYESVNRLPDAWFDVLRTEIGSSRVYYESQSRGGWLEREFADYGNPSNPPAASYDTTRFDTRQALYMPNTMFGFLNVVPRAVYHGIYYGDTLTRETREVLPAPGAAATNDAPNTETVYLPAGSQLRSLFELGLESSFKAYGLYEDDAGRYRHIVEPYFNYTLIPEPNLRPYELPQFDAVDKLDKNHQVRFGTRHQIQRKVGDAVRTPLDADLYGIYAIEDANDESGMRTIGLDSQFRPADSIRLQVDGTYDVEAAEIDEVNVWLTVWNQDLWEAEGEFFYRPDESTLFAGSLTYALTDAWSVNVYSRYEAESGRLEEQAGYLQYQLDCIAFRLRGRYLPGFTRDDGTEREDDYRISFYVWLRAFPPDRLDKDR
ncbi:MAG: hypothetical protein PHR35_09545 [Kiritimatiellae bacterium]|nr:hypothetical protein [Kiritimatiellia bacterium]